LKFPGGNVNQTDESSHFDPAVGYPVNKSSFAGDVDDRCLCGNATGSQVSLRAYWINNSFSANVTNDVPNESRLEPHEWGTATVE